MPVARIVYRFHGRFVSEAKAASLANLKNASKFLSMQAGDRLRSGYHMSPGRGADKIRESKRRAQRSLERQKTPVGQEPIKRQREYIQDEFSDDGDFQRYEDGTVYFDDFDMVDIEEMDFENRYEEVA